jgi:hypothetical protein
VELKDQGHIWIIVLWVQLDGPISEKEVGSQGGGQVDLFDEVQVVALLRVVLCGREEAESGEVVVVSLGLPQNGSVDCNLYSKSTAVLCDGLQPEQVGGVFVVES